MNTLETMTVIIASALVLMVALGSFAGRGPK